MRDPILNATLNMTQACNLACSYCFVHGKTKKKMPFAIAKKCVDFLLCNARETDPISMRGRQRKIDISFWGGEPLIEWDMIKNVVKYAEKNSGDIPISFGGTTNGTFFTEEKFGYIGEHHINLLISFDGTEVSHNTHRRFLSGMGSHAPVAKNIEKGLKWFPGLGVRMSPFAEGIHRFHADVKYIIDMGIRNFMFSPVYESGWTPGRWEIFRDQADRVGNLISELRKKGQVIDIEHYKSYAKSDGSNYPCGAGRFYVGFDVDGAIYPCHRFNKFDDDRHWSKKPVCIGHIDHGITNPWFRDQFINWEPSRCGTCEQAKTTPCHGGCFAINYDFTGTIRTAPDVLCEYTKMQSRISEDYRKGFGEIGFPFAQGIDVDRPTPEGIMAVIKQIGDKINFLENKFIA